MPAWIALDPAVRVSNSKWQLGSVLCVCSEFQSEQQQLKQQEAEFPHWTLTPIGCRAQICSIGVIRVCPNLYSVGSCSSSYSLFGPTVGDHQWGCARARPIVDWTSTKDQRSLTAQRRSSDSSPPHSFHIFIFGGWSTIGQFHSRTCVHDLHHLGPTSHTVCSHRKQQKRIGRSSKKEKEMHIGKEWNAH